MVNFKNLIALVITSLAALSVVAVAIDSTCTAGGWCNPPLQHFDLSEKMFLQIAEYKAGIVPVKYRRVLCYKQGGVQFQIGVNPNWLLVLPFNVAGAGDIVVMKVKGSSTGWMQMTRN
ncbi:hypothetical protein ACFE04_011488 [Oxalis oulophora]